MENCDGNIDSIIDLTFCFRRMDTNESLINSTVKPPSYFEIMANKNLQIHVHYRKIPRCTLEKLSNDCSYLYDLYKEKDLFIKTIEDTPLEFDIPRLNMLSHDEILNLKDSKFKKSFKKLFSRSKKDDSLVSNNSQRSNSISADINLNESTGTLLNTTYSNTPCVLSQNIPWISAFKSVLISWIIMIILQFALGTKNHILFWILVCLIGYLRVIILHIQAYI